jgi:hypothetical protein
MHETLIHAKLRLPLKIKSILHLERCFHWAIHRGKIGPDELEMERAMKLTVRSRKAKLQQIESGQIE